MSRAFWKKSGVIGAFVGPAIVVVFLVVQMTRVEAADTPFEPAPAAPEVTNSEPGTVNWQRQNAFVQYPPGGGHQTYDDMSAEDKEIFDAAKAHYDTHGASVAEAYSRGTKARVEAAKLIRAERESGLQGTADVGVD